MTARIGKESILLLVLPVAFMLGACASVGPPVLERAVIGYDETDGKLSQKLLLLNIARWRAGKIPHITVTSSIAATFDWTASTGIGGQIEESQGTDFFNLDFGARASENPTFSIVPLHGQDYIDRLIKPFTEDALQLLVFEGNIAVDRLLRLVGEGIELYGSTGEFQRFIGNSPERPEEYTEFRRIVLHLRWLAENRELFIRPLIFEDVLIRDITGRPSAEDLAKVISENFYTTVCDSLHTRLRRGQNRMKPNKTAVANPLPAADHTEDIKLAASKMSLIDRRAFQAEMAVKYCAGNARRAEDIFGWSREAVQLGLHERRTGVVCLSAQSVVGGDKLWEEKHLEVAKALWSLAQSHSQQDPSFRGPLAYTRLTAAEALRQLRARGFSDELLPSPSTMAEVLNRNGYRLRPVLKAKPKKKSRKPTPSSPTSTSKIRAAKTRALCV